MRSTQTQPCSGWPVTLRFAGTELRLAFDRELENFDEALGDRGQVGILAMGEAML
jgi:hypothetical protein